MTKEELTKANEIQKEIKELDFFIWKAEHAWTGKIIKRKANFIFKTDAYGASQSAEYNMNTEMKNKVLDVLKQHLVDLKKELESI